MSSAATRYQTRSPRYVLNANDHVFMRFAGMDTRGTAVHAEMINLSETGLLFTIPATPEIAPPEEGDMLKIEFTIPNHKQIACFATVIRVEQQTDWSPDLGDRHFQIVALHFRNLPHFHQRALQLGLIGKPSQDDSNQSLSRPTAETFIFAGLTFALFINFYLLSLKPQAWINAVRFLL